MAFRVRYSATVDWIGPGLGPMSGALAASSGPMPGAGGAQTLEFQNATVGGQNSNTFTAADITTLTNAIAADLSTQFNASIARIQAFSTGGG
jgi:hypothetical protein